MSHIDPKRPDFKDGVDFAICLFSCAVIYAIAAVAIMLISSHTNAAPYLMSMLEVVRW